MGYDILAALSCLLARHENLVVYFPDWGEMLLDPQYPNSVSFPLYRPLIILALASRTCRSVNDLVAFSRQTIYGWSGERLGYNTQ